MKFNNPAACVGADTESFFPDVGANTQTINTLKKICSGCLAFDECFTYAMHNTVEGIWAGTTRKDRQLYRRLNNIKSKPLYMPEDYGLPRNERTTSE